MEFLDTAYSFNFEGISEDGVYKFRFISNGGKEITKVISISPIKGAPNYYNLGFGNLEVINGELKVNDTSEDNNNDYDRVLATVFMSALYFFKLRTDAIIIFFGNTVHKHRIYKQKISVNLKSLKENLNVSGGFLNNEIKIIEKEQIVIKKGKERKRIIKEKDIEAILAEGIDVKDVVEYKMHNSSTYQFVLLELKQV